MTANGRESDVANGRFVEGQLVESGFGRTTATEIADRPLGVASVSSRFWRAELRPEIMRTGARHANADAMGSVEFPASSRSTPKFTPDHAGALKPTVAGRDEADARQPLVSSASRSHGYETAKK